MISGEGFTFEVSDCKKLPDGKFLHIGTLTEGSCRVGTAVRAEINLSRRRDIMRNHSSACLLYTSKKRAQSDSTVWVTIPEGRELREIFETLEENGVATVEGLTNAMNTHEFDYAFLKDLPKRENKLEGYLFPDTYEFYKNEDPVNVLDKMLKKMCIRDRSWCAAI